MSNILNNLSTDPKVLYYKTERQITDNYDLKKDFKLKGVNTAILPIEVIRKCNDIDEERILKQQFGESIINFINVIKQNIPDSDLVLFYNNFNYIKTSVKNFKLLNAIFGEHIAAQWIPERNTIELSKNNYKSTIDHELLHVATTYIDPKTNVIFCGFQQAKNSNEIIGEGLNEGYTQYLAEKYFASSSKAYSYEKRIAELVELIVGQENMQSLYFNANLKGLTDVLKQYDTEENVYNFITDLDFLIKNLTDKRLTANSNQIILSSLRNVNSFLVQTYTKKVILEYSGEQIDLKEVFSKVIPLLNIIPIEIKLHGKSITIIDENYMLSLIHEVFSCYEPSEDMKTVLK